MRIGHVIAAFAAWNETVEQVRSAQPHRRSGSPPSVPGAEARPVLIGHVLPRLSAAGPEPQRERMARRRSRSTVTALHTASTPPRDFARPRVSPPLG